MKKEKVIESCYSQLRKVTPLNFDCGKICNGKCCKGDEKTGMILFPGEEEFIDNSKVRIDNSGSIDETRNQISKALERIYEEELYG